KSINIVKSFTAKNNIIILKGKWNGVFSIIHNDSTNIFSNNFIVSDSGGGITGGKASYLNNTIMTSLNAIVNIEYVNRMKNNIIITTNGPLFRAGIAFNSINSDYNLLHSPSTYDLCTILDTNVASIANFAAWQQTGEDQHSQWGIPLFSKPYDFHLQPGNTLALGAGTPIPGLTYDIEGDLRDAVHPDIGADEFVIHPIIDTAYNACIGNSFTLDAGAGFSSYLWSNNATTQTITLSSSTGSAAYSCTVTYGVNSGSKSTNVHWVNCTNIKSITESNYQISTYPNPFTNKLTLEFSETFVSANVVLYDIVGKQVMKFALSSLKTELNTSVLQKGIYLLKVVTEDGNVYVGKVVKE
ncbi:T9SS type A sorting domain-containing protein, partial [Bacteroidota bacterium]